MKISAIEIRDFKRIKSVNIKPNTDSVIMLIGGNNAQGKTSILDALTSAFGGQKQTPDKAIREGTDEAYIRVELDDGIIVERIITEDKSHIEVRSADGATFKSPQAMLDKLVGGRFLDPLAFLRIDPKKQRALILDIADKDRRIPKLDEKRQSAFDQRTEVNREIRMRKPLLEEASRSVTDEALTPIDVHAEQATLGRLNQVNRTQAELSNNQSLVEQRYRVALQRVKNLTAEISIAEEDARRIAEECVFASQQADKHEKENGWQSTQASEDQIAAVIRRIDDAAKHNAKIQDQVRSREIVDAETAKLAKLEQRATELTAVLAEIDRRKSEILASAKLPAGLAVADDSILLNGIPFDQASGAEQFGVALQLSIAANPKLQDVWIRDGALLDDDHLAELEKSAKSSDIRCWVERVGSRDPGAIIISDGTIAERGAV